MLRDYIRDELILLDWSADSRTSLFKKLSQLLREKNFVTEGFQAFLSEREDNFPTGLSLAGYNVAIPHGDPQFIKEPFIAFIRLKESIDMRKMDDPDETIPVSLFFVLGLDNGSGHLDILRQLINRIQDEQFIKSLEKIDDRQKLAVLLKEV